jgi:general secretion pathway protein E
MINQEFNSDFINCIEELLVSSLSDSDKLMSLKDKLTLPDDELLALLSAYYFYVPITYDEMMADYDPCFEVVSFSESIQKNCLLLRNSQDEYTFVFANIFDDELQLWAVEKIADRFSTCIASSSDISAYLTKQEERLNTVNKALLEVNSEANHNVGIEELSINTIEGNDNAVVKLVRSTLYDALKVEASDIHIEMTSIGLAIKYRLDGVLSHTAVIRDKSMAEQVISRIKVMAELDITETRVPQDGRFRVEYRHREIDFRVSVMPSVHGEDVVIRILDKQSLTEHVDGLRLDALGFNQHSMEAMRKQFHYPYGMILVTGPTGSGKTTTLYAAISEINSGQDKIITIEDPVEYQLPGVLQIPVNEKKGLSFSLGLRSILRHDPDKIMVGEIRDSDTAQIAVQSALTGHLVFTTVHANNSFDVIGRFLNMGVDPYSFVSALNVVIAQRLIRTICPHCAISIEGDEHFVQEAGVIPPSSAKLVRSNGCGACRGTGYKGRRAIAEILCLDDELRELIVTRAPIGQIKEIARMKGTKLLRDAALDMAWAGYTTIEEVNRVTAMV